MWDKITMEDLTEEQRSIAEVIGIEGYRLLVERLGGQSIYIAKLDTMQRGLRDKEILEAFNGSNYAELARRYNLTERAVRNICDNSPKHSMFCKKNQVSIFEEQE